MIVIGLQDSDIGFSDVLPKGIVHIAQVGCNQDAMFPVADEKTGIIGSIMRNREGNNPEFANRKFHVVLQIFPASNKLLSHAVTVVHPVVRLGRSIDRYVVLFSQGTNGFDMVVVIVRDEDAENLAEIDANLPKLLADGPGTNSCIYQNALHGVSEVVTVATASAAKA